MTDQDLCQALRALGSRIEADVPVDLAPAVLGALPTRPTGRPRWVRTLVIAMAIVVLAAGGAIAASDSLREWLFGEGVDLRRVTTLPAVSTVRGPAELGAGTETTPAAAAAAMGMTLPTSPQLGPPDAVLLARTAAGPAVTLVWRAGPDLPGAPFAPGIGALLTIGPERDANDPFMITKETSPGTTTDFVRIPGIGEAGWIAGAPHAVTLSDGTQQQFRLAANVLLWSQGSRLHRLETTLGKAEATALAAGLR